MFFRSPLLRALAVLILFLPLNALAETYELLYLTRIDPDTGSARVEIRLEGDSLPSELNLNLSSGRYTGLESDQPLQIEGDRAIWKPTDSPASLHYQFEIDEQKDSGSYDSRITDDWAILRSDKLIPPMSVTAERGLQSRAELHLALPKDWSSALPYEELEREHHYRLVDPGRRFIRPKGWMIVGRIGSRQDEIAGIDTKVAAPLGENIRRQDTLAFLNWTLPELEEVFPDFPERLLIVMAGDPMWRGGLSGTRSLFMHADRPLVSGNRTSSLIHELVHVATGIHGDEESDWIVEGIAEFYALEILRRSGGISEQRYEEAMEELEEWGEDAPTLFKRRSSGPVTARAVGVMRRLDREIRDATDGEESIDDVARELAEDDGEVSLAKLQRIAEEVAGTPIEMLERSSLDGKAD